MATNATLPILRNPPGAAMFSKVPEVVGVEITGRCNLRCRHCFNHSGPENPHELPLQVIERLLDAMLTWNVRTLRISGGEPTVHRQFREIVDACNQRRIHIGLNTNGIYSSEMLAYLWQAPIELFFVSLDGLEANHDAIRGRGTFRRAVGACRKLLEAGQKVMIGFHVGEGNRRDLAGLITLSAQLQVDFKVAPIRPIGRAVDELPSELIRADNYYEVVRQVVQLRRRFPHIRIYTDFDILEKKPANDCYQDPQKASCRAGRSMININYDGGIYPCVFFVTGEGEFSAGNIYRDSVTEVWQNPAAFQEFRVQRKSDTCQGCGHYQRSCAGGCSAISYAVSGKLDTLDATCFAHLVEPTDFTEMAQPARLVEPLHFANLVDPPGVILDDTGTP
jgi:radical SAM protein with 4Fe4S-binding SPASM domain